MYFNAIGGAWDAASAARPAGYGPAIDGLRSFDSLSAAVRARQDAIQRSAGALASYPQPALGSVPIEGSTLAGALATYASSEAGRAKLEGLARAASGFFSRIFGSGGPEQLRLPLDV